MKTHLNKAPEVAAQDDTIFHSAVQQTLKGEPEAVVEETPIATEEEEEDENLDTLEDFDILLGGEEEEEVEAPKPLDPSLVAMADTVKNLAEALKPAAPIIARKKRATPQVVDEKALREDFNRQLHETDDPYSLIHSMAQQLIAPSMASQSVEIQKLKKEMLKQDVKYSYVMEKYDDEIENFIADLQPQLQSHPDAYKFAADQVLINHFDDVVNYQSEQVDKKKIVSTRPGKTKTINNSQRASVKPETPTRKRLRATAAEEAMARKFGISLKDAILRNRRK